MSETPPAGWYPDPQDGTRQRYWDGTAWTEHTAEGQGTAGGAMSTTGVSAARATAAGDPDTWTWQSIVVTILCCGGPFGVAGIFNAGKAEGALSAGDTQAASTYGRRARNWTLVGLGFGVLVLIGFFVFSATVGAAFNTAMSEDCGNAEVGSMQYEFCTGVCMEDVTGTPFEAMCEDF